MSELIPLCLGNSFSTRAGILDAAMESLEEDLSRLIFGRMNLSPLGVVKDGVVEGRGVDAKVGLFKEEEGGRQS